MSDALTDIARSNRLNKVYSDLVESQMSFISFPNQERLMGIYNACEKLSTCPGGYWGESEGRGISEVIEEYYKNRFGDEYNKKSINVEDLVFLLEGVHSIYRLGCLAEIMAMKKTGSDEWKEYREEVYKILETLASNVSLEQNEKLEAKKIKTKMIEDIFSKVGFGL